MSESILVALIAEESNYSRSSLIRSAFSQDPFQFIDFNQPDGSEIETFRAALRTAKLTNPEANCILIKDTSVTTLDSSEILEAVMRIQEVLTRGRYDLAYLDKWQDQCQLQVKLEKPDPNRKVEIVRTQYPLGTQAILFTPSGRDILLGTKKMANGRILRVAPNIDLQYALSSQIYHGNITAITTIPNLFNYDIALNAMTNQDYQKVNECDPIEIQPDTSTSRLGNLIWFLLVVLIVLIVAWAIVRVGPKHNQ